MTLSVPAFLWVVLETSQNRFKTSLLASYILVPPKQTATRFVLVRDDGVAGNILEMAGVAAAARGGGGGGGVPPTRATTAAVTATTTLPKSTTATIPSFKGRAIGCEVAGLAPNTLYQFRVRAVNARTRSSLSAPLEVRQPDRQTRGYRRDGKGRKKLKTRWADNSLRGRISRLDSLIVLV